MTHDGYSCMRFTRIFVHPNFSVTSPTPGLPPFFIRKEINNLKKILKGNINHLYLVPVSPSFCDSFTSSTFTVSSLTIPTHLFMYVPYLCLYPLINSILFVHFSCKRGVSWPHFFGHSTSRVLSHLQMTGPGVFEPVQPPLRRLFCPVRSQSP